MNTISDKSRLILQDVLKSVIKKIEIKKNHSFSFFESKDIELIQFPINKEIEAINKFFDIMETNINEEDILKIELDDYIITFGAIEEFINELNKISEAATLHYIKLGNNFNFSKKINELKDAKYEFVEFYNNVKWPK